MEDMVIPDVMDDLILPKGRYSENFVLISLLEVCQEGGTLRPLRVPNYRHGGQGQGYP